MRFSTGCHRRTRTLSIAAAVAVAAGAGGVHLGLSNSGAQAATSTVTVSTTAQLESAVARAAAGTVIQVRAGTYYPTATLKSTAGGTRSARVTLEAHGSRLARNLSVGNKGGLRTLGSAASNWDSGVATPAFRSTDATTAYGARGASGSLPATTFLTTGSSTIGATTN
ncbi:hypothetical protein ACFV2H_17220 [Streptomyces sp. NPDC059629]|uniref:hypothetical protein n=1 Tax=Streptomyces sp. NPDC059629 TaxID=3346889 RepID=UPI0036C4E504